jgi:serine/threonine-protein kinase
MTSTDTSPTDRVLAGRYRLDGRRGAGIDIAVFDAYDLGLERHVLVKIVHPDLCAAPGFDEHFRSSIQRAASIDHPNVGRILDWGGAQWGGRSVQFVVTDLLTGGSLRDLLDRGRLLSPSQAIMIGVDACRGLDVAHRLGVDVRPATLVFGGDGRLRVIDLGLSGVVSGPMWAEPSAVSIERARYASPEQAAGAPAEAKSDVYSLCLSLIEAITGQVPFLGDSTVATLANRVDKLMPVSADLGPLAAVLERAGRPELEGRYSAAEFGRALVQAAEKLPRPAPLALAGTGLFADAAEVATDVESASASAAQQPVAPSPPPTIVPPPPPPLSPSAASPGQAGQLPQDDRVPTSAAALVPPPPQPDHSAPILREKRSRRKLFAVLAVVILAAGVGGSIAWWSLRDQSHIVPDLVGIEQGEAVNQVSAFGWTVTVIDEASDTVAAGNVIRTDPVAGAKLGDGSAFTIVASRGPAPRALPELTGATVEQATVTLQALGLALQVGNQVNDETVPPGVIISWSVPDQPGLVAGATVMPGVTVVAVVSAGPAPRVIPDLTGLSLTDATAKLQELGLVVAQLPDEFSPTVLVGGVARQDPAAGAEISRGGTINVAVSKGPDLVIVPPLAALTVQQTTDVLATAGLTLGVVKGDPTGLAVLAEVNGQAIGAGITLPRGAAVDVTFAVPPPPTTTIDPAAATTTVAPA